MTLKEQSQAVVLLREWFDLVSKLPPQHRSPEAADLIDRTDKFINHDNVAAPPEIGCTCTVRNARTPSEYREHDPTCPVHRPRESHGARRG